jgi:hypothetical protein
MSEPDALATIDIGGIEYKGKAAAARNDLEAVGALIAEVLEQQSAMLTLARTEEAVSVELSREQAAVREGLSHLPEAEARTRWHDAQFSLSYHQGRAQNAAQQATALGNLLTTLRTLSMEVQGRQIAARCLEEGERLQDEIETAKRALEPLFVLFERAFALQREIDTFNQTVESGSRLPSPQMVGDANILRRVREIRLQIPNRWRELLRPVSARRQRPVDELVESIARNY